MLGKALLCIAGQCHPVLVGDTTPTGTFPLTPTSVSGFNGEILVFHVEGSEAFAIHRTASPRRKGMYVLPVSQRRSVTGGCVDIPSSLYDQVRHYKKVQIEP